MQHWAPRFTQTLITRLKHERSESRRVIRIFVRHIRVVEAVGIISGIATYVFTAQIVRPYSEASWAEIGLLAALLLAGMSIFGSVVDHIADRIEQETLLEHIFDHLKTSTEVSREQAHQIGSLTDPIGSLLEIIDRLIDNQKTITDRVRRLEDALHVHGSAPPDRQ